MEKGGKGELVWPKGDRVVEWDGQSERVQS